MRRRSARSCGAARATTERARRRRSFQAAGGSAGRAGTCCPVWCHPFGEQFGEVVWWSLTDSVAPMAPSAPWPKKSTPTARLPAVFRPGVSPLRRLYPIG